MLAIPKKIAIESLGSFLGEMEKVACIWNYFLKVVQKIYRISSLFKVRVSENA